MSYGAYNHFKRNVKENSFPFIVCARSGQDPVSCGLVACDNGCDEIEIEAINIEKVLTLFRASMQIHENTKNFGFDMLDINGTE